MKIGTPIIFWVVIGCLMLVIVTVSMSIPVVRSDTAHYPTHEPITSFTPLLLAAVGVAWPLFYIWYKRGVFDSGKE